MEQGGWLKEAKKQRKCLPSFLPAFLPSIHSFSYGVS
jgi:hypothetical protein